jgi:hypothetical protein
MNIDNERIYNLYDELKFTDLNFYLEENFYLQEEYFRCEDEYGFVWVDDKTSSFVNAAYDVISRYPMEYEGTVKMIRKELMSSENLTNDEISILVTAFISKYFKRRIDMRSAGFQSDEWASDHEKVEYYGSRGIASSRGYDNYMDSHVGGDFELLNKSVEVCYGNDKSIGTR